MATFKQYIYSNENSPYNQNITSGTQLTQGLNFDTAVSRIAIQALPGTKFYLNASTEPVIVGFIGYVEIDLTDTGASVHSIRIDNISLQNIQSNNSAVLIIDTYSIQ